MRKISFILLLLSFQYLWPQPDPTQVIKWAHQNIKPLFLSDDIKRVQAAFSKEVWPEALAIRKNLDIVSFGKAELDQHAIIDKTPAWRVIFHIKAREQNKKNISSFKLQLLILENKQNQFKITHIDKFESHMTIKKKK